MIRTISIRGFSSTSPFTAVAIAILLIGGLSPIYATPAPARELVLSPILLREKFMVADLDHPMQVLIETDSQDYASLVGAIREAGGSVSFQYRYIDAIAATVPVGALDDIASHSSVRRIMKDATRELAIPKRGEQPLGGPYFLLEDALAPLDVYRPSLGELRSFDPRNFFNPDVTGATAIWDRTDYGLGSIIGIIDTGINSGHFMFPDPDVDVPKVVGGVDGSFDVGTEFEGFDAISNHWHGSFVAGVAAGDAAALFFDGLLTQSIELHTGASLPSGPVFDGEATKIVPLFGQAPLAQLFIIKVFDHTGGGVPESLIIAGIEVAIDAKVIDGIDIDVLNLSLGGASLFDGRDLEDQTIDAATAAGITVVTAAGNDGPSPMSTGSPGTANTAIAVAAASDPVHSRVFWDVNFGLLGFGNSIYTDDVSKIFSFSSRGPTADGRQKPALTATGVFLLSAFAQEDDFGLAFSSGTSFSAPTVAGTAALLNTWAESNGVPAGPYDFKKALSLSADDIPGGGPSDKGAGYLDARGALHSLMLDTIMGCLPCSHPPLPTEAMLYDITNIELFSSYSTSVTLDPGYKQDFVFSVPDDVLSVEVSLTEVEVSANPDPLAQFLYPNSFEVYVHSAARSGAFDYYADTINVLGDTTFLITDDETAVAGDFFGEDIVSHVLEPGFMKVTLEGDWTNSEPVSAVVTIILTGGAELPDPTFVGSVATGEVAGFSLSVPEGTEELVVELAWTRDWSTYPTSDLDLILIAPDMTQIFDGATLNSPERVVLVDPDPGTWSLVIVGFQVNPGELAVEEFEGFVELG